MNKISGQLICIYSRFFFKKCANRPDGKQLAFLLALHGQARARRLLGPPLAVALTGKAKRERAYCTYRHIAAGEARRGEEHSDLSRLPDDA
jgi:hypothetical protein